MTRGLRRAGFTLVELLVVIAVLAIVLAIAAPGLRSFIADQRVRALSYDLTTDLLLARSEALKRNAAVVVQRSGDDWHGGWTTAAGTLELSRRNAIGDAIVFEGAPPAMTFDANGRVAAPTDPVRITLSSSAAGAQRCVALDLSGRARSSLGPCS